MYLSKALSQAINYTINISTAVTFQMVLRVRHRQFYAWFVNLFLPVTTLAVAFD